MQLLLTAKRSSSAGGGGGGGITFFELEFIEFNFKVELFEAGDVNVLRSFA